jgi:DNA (cytosine-5)-methyltransferase 1
MARSGQRTLAWRVLDSQYFGLAQRRKRVFVVLDLRGERAVQILLEPEGVRRDTPPRREAGQGTARAASFSAGNSSGTIQPTGNATWCADIAPTLGKESNSPKKSSSGQMVDFSIVQDYGSTKALQGHATVTPPLGAAGGVTSMPTLHKNNSDLDFLVAVLRPWEAVGFYGNMGTQGGGFAMEVAPPLKDAKNMSSVAYRMRAFGDYADDDTASTVKERDYKDSTDLVLSPTLTASNDPSRSPQSQEITSQVEAVNQAGFGVRRLTPTECARLQGFNDDWNDDFADTVRYRQFGNAVSVNVTSWLGGRIVRYAELQD